LNDIYKHCEVQYQK